MLKLGLSEDALPFSRPILPRTPILPTPVRNLDIVFLEFHGLRAILLRVKVLHS